MKEIEEFGATRKDERPRFLVRQLTPNQTTGQLLFDIAFGAVAPLLCFYFDPIVFRASFGRPLYESYQFFSYSITAIEAPLLVLWLVCNTHLRSVAPLFGGVLFAGALFSFVLGMAILPFSLIGLMMGIGIFGFTPFVTAFVYFRNGWRALQRSRFRGSQQYIVEIVMAAMFSIALPALADFQVSRTVTKCVDTILRGDTQQAEVAVSQLRWIPFVPERSTSEIVAVYQVETDPHRRDQLKRWYRDITGSDIDTRIRILHD